VASQDPVQWFERYPNRFRMWHIKDMTGLAQMQARQTAQFTTPPGERPAGEGGGRPTGGMPQPGTRPATGPAPLGEGDIDYRPIIAAWQKAGLEYFFVEQDAAGAWPGGSLASIQKTFDSLKRLLG
jgi:sugar phosphate isomerase/epimerase